MYKKISTIVANIFLKKKILAEDKYALFKYGCELIISNIVYTLIFLIISILTNTFVPSLLFYAGFLITRNFCGGYHASSYIRCHLLFAFNHFLFIVFVYLLPNNLYTVFLILFSIICFFSIAIWAPVDHKNKQFTKGEYHFFRKCSLFLSILIATGISVSIIFLPTTIYVISIMFGILSAVISMLVAKYQRRNYPKYKES